MTDNPHYCMTYDLSKARRNKSSKILASHQSEALAALSRWHESPQKPHAGTILVLPTGGGKTLTAVRFLCQTALSDGYKVLWLAHTHHLLEQAFESLVVERGHIAEPRRKLTVRVVSGMKDHYEIHDIKQDDDVIIATLQTISKAYKVHHRALESFLKSADGKLFVVFDEAHHAPAPSYRKFVHGLRDRIPKMRLLGLTATPTYTDERREGWLAELFPQKIVYQVAPDELMAQGILAEPVTEQYETYFEPDFDEQEYQKWIGTFKDIPENIIEQLAENKPRNEYIGATYVGNRKKYGKTIIFADRWYQCEVISKYLEERKVRAGSVYSHVVKGVSKKTADENNKRVIDDFKAGKLDVILNVRMLTEGTDVPDAETAFITRQTTSRNLLTQMVGRALRGPKFGGTEKAHIVFFTDNWQQLINWAEYDIKEGGLDPADQKYGERPPLQYISIELVRKLAMQMDSGSNINPIPFMSLLPIGWYIVEYTTHLNGSDKLDPLLISSADELTENDEQLTERDSLEQIKRFVMVFDHEEEGYRNLVNGSLKQNLAKFEDESVQFDGVRDLVNDLETQYFPNRQRHFGSNLDQDIFCILRHIAQNGSPPKFFPFEDRRNHDLDLIANELINIKMTDREKNEMLKEEFDRDNRYWKVIYPSYHNFKSHYDGCVNRILFPPQPQDNDGTPEKAPEPPLTPEIKTYVKERDEYKCLCCGTEIRRYLQVDHIDPKYYDGSDDPENLQTLCGKCNSRKGTDKIDFRNSKTKLAKPPKSLPSPLLPEYLLEEGPKGRMEFVRRKINFFYQCGAVNRIVIDKRENNTYEWVISLHGGNDPKWLEPHLPELVKLVVDPGEPTKQGTPSKMAVLSKEGGNEKKEGNGSDKPAPPNWIKNRISGKDEMKFVASRKSSKYHFPSCGWAKRIPPEDRIGLPNIGAAKSRGYHPCSVCNPDPGALSESILGYSPFGGRKPNRRRKRS